MNDVLEPPDEPTRPMPTLEERSPSPGGFVDTQTVDDAAYSAFYRAEIKALVNFLLWMGAGVADAADLAQETMIDAYGSWATIHTPRAWIRRVASRKHARRRIDRDESPADLADDHNPLLKASDDLSEWEQRHDVLRLLAKGPPEYYLAGFALVRLSGADSAHSPLWTV
jgi:DNA-directed RNA polymerase specialized sigma24 family protein